MAVSRDMCGYIGSFNTHWRDGVEFRARILGQRMKVQPIDDENHHIQHTLQRKLARGA